SNRKIAAKEQARAMEILKQPEWHDFGPTFASQQLAKRHKLEVSKETLRAWMIECGLWKPGSRKIEDVHCWRPRRSGFGELVQWDTSDHDWLEGRGPVRYLVRLNGALRPKVRVEYGIPQEGWLHFRIPDCSERNIVAGAF